MSNVPSNAAISSEYSPSLEVNLRAKLLCLLWLVAPAASAEDASISSSQLDGYEFQYTYEDGGEVILTLYDGLVEFEWIQGPMKGAKGQGLPYRSRLIDEDVYFLNWHNKENGNYPTLYIDIPGKRIFGSAVIGYNSEAETVDLFDSAVITRVER
ncbi:MAG: hypothetical protein AAGE43_01495 [Pseudomonadota bacterium]